MASPSRMVDLPVELLDMIASHLVFKDVCCFRLTTPEIAAKVAQGSFKAHFATKSLPITNQALRSFATVTQSGWLCCALEELTFVIDFPAVTEASHEPYDPETAELLTKSFDQLRSNSRGGRLRSIILRAIRTITLRDTPYVSDWHTIWLRAGVTARLIMLAVRKSALQVESLDLFSTVGRCALTTSCLLNLFDILEPSKVKSLSLVASADQNGGADHKGLAFSKGFSRFLGRSRSLEHLSIRWFNIRLLDTSDAELRDRHFFSELTTLNMPCLTSVDLKGIYTTSENILVFLNHHLGLLHLALEDVHLEEGKFDTIFALIAKHTTLEDIYMRDLWESRLIQFVGATGKSHFPHPGPATWIRRQGPDAREKIQYKVMAGRIKESAKANNWNRKRTLWYGPPE